MAEIAVEEGADDDDDDICDMEDFEDDDDLVIRKFNNLNSRTSFY